MPSPPPPPSEEPRPARRASESTERNPWTLRSEPVAGVAGNLKDRSGRRRTASRSAPDVPPGLERKPEPEVSPQQPQPEQTRPTPEDSGLNDKLVQILDKLATHSTAPRQPRATISVKPIVNWPIFGDDNHDLDKFLDEFNAMIGLANDGSGMSNKETLVALRGCLKGTKRRV